MNFTHYPTKLKILDLFCGAGGSAQGIADICSKYKIAYEILGIDIKDQPNYPFKFLKANLELFDPTELKFKPNFIWASPPCQKFSVGSAWMRNKGKEYADLIDLTRDWISYYNRPSVIENVVSAPIRDDLMLCGQMFRKKIYRHRKFEISGFDVKKKNHLKHDTRKSIGYEIFSIAGHGKGSLKQWQQAMGIKWMNKDELTQAVPPVYSRYIFEQFLRSNYKKKPNKRQDCNCP
jgi:DNA (cytosine-5)-methyltransferase 1